MDERAMMKLVAKVMFDGTIQPVVMQIPDAYRMISALKLAVKYPMLNALTRMRLLHAAHEFEAAILHRHPGALVTPPEDMSEEAFIEKAMPALSDENPLEVDVTVGDVWHCVTGIQTALRHPAIDPESFFCLMHIGKELQRALVLVHPTVNGVLEAGWNPGLDVRVEGT